jgi:hypothetical protein
LLSYASVVITNKYDAFCDLCGYRSLRKALLLLFTLDAFVHVPPLLLFSGASVVFGGKSQINMFFLLSGNLELLGQVT